MSYCINCGQKLTEGARFCAGCGSPVGTANNTTQRKQEWAGSIIKCPNCNDNIPSFTTTCPSCGLELRNTKASSSVREFAMKLEEIEKTREHQSSKSFIGKLFGSDGHINKTDQQKITLIKSFPIPNTKEDILEFMILASSNINFKLYGLGDKGIITASQREVSDAWFAKMEQVYEKTNILFDDKSDYNQVKSIYDKVRKKLRRKKLELPLLLLFSIGILIGFILIIALLPEPSIEDQIESRNIKLENVVEKIEDDIVNGNFIDARNKAYTLTFDDELSVEYSEYWEEKQQEILIQIDEANGEQYDKSMVNNSTKKTIFEGINDIFSEVDKKNNDILEENIKVSADVKVQSNKYLELKEFEWFINNGYLNCIITITNTSNKYAIEFPSFRITAYDRKNNILGVEEQVLSIIYPNQDFTCYCLLFEISEAPNKIDVNLLEPDEFNIIDTNLLEHSTHKQMIGKNISVNKDSVTGEIYNPNNYSINSAMVTIIFRDSKENIIFGEHTFVNQISAKGTIPFEVTIFSKDNLPPNCEVLAYIW